jgi:hypothetical protein
MVAAAGRISNIESFDTSAWFDFAHHGALSAGAAHFDKLSTSRTG